MHDRASDYLYVAACRDGGQMLKGRDLREVTRFRLYRSPKRRTYTIYDGLLTPHDDRQMNQYWSAG